MHPVISIIVPALNEEKLIERTLGSFSRELRSQYDVELIVSDGGSTDHTLEIARRHADMVIERSGDQRQTAGEQRNRGAERASGDLLVFMDADTVPANPQVFMRELSRLATEMKEDRRLLAMACPIDVAPKERKLTDRIFHAYINFGIRRANLQGKGSGGGQCTVVRREAFYSLGGYRSDLVACEDWELYVRLARHGKIGYGPGLSVYESPGRYRRFGHLRVYLVLVVNGLAIKYLGRAICKEWKPVR